jgi:hypothetical protein
MKFFIISLAFIATLSLHLFSQTKPPLKSLNVGNFWVYKYGSSKAPRPDIRSDGYERVVGTQTINGTVYARVFNSYFQQYFLERSDSNTVYRWNGIQNREVVAFSLNWKEGDTVNFEFFWHGCMNCRYIVQTPSKFYNSSLRDTTFSFYLADIIPKGFQPVAPYQIIFARKYLFNQLDTNRLNSMRTSDEVAGTTFLKGAYVDGVVLRDTNIITSVVEPPIDPVAQSKQTNAATTQATTPRIAVALSAENPFTQRTQVRYRLEQAGTVELAVYSTQGVRLTSIQRGYQSVGEHTATWNGTNAEGLDVPTGAYFLVVFVNDKQAGEVKVIKQR